MSQPQDSNLPPSRALAEAMAQTRYEDLPAATVAETRRAVLDWLGSCMAGALEPPAQRMRAVIATWGRCDESSVFGGTTGAERLTAAAAPAALANGVASHILELDDVHKGSTLHAAAPIIPALTVAEREHASRITDKLGQRWNISVFLDHVRRLRTVRQSSRRSRLYDD